MMMRNVEARLVANERNILLHVAADVSPDCQRLAEEFGGRVAHRTDIHDDENWMTEEDISDKQIYLVGDLAKMNDPESKPN